MSFELLPNETILDLFEYIPIYDLFHSFFNLNSRFNQLLCVQFRKFHLDLRLLSKTKFDQICKNYVPLIIDRIISLYLSDDNNTPQMIELFFSQPFQLRRFTHLQSITFSGLGSHRILDRVLDECSQLPCLTHLTFSGGYIPMDQSDRDRFFNHIWSLKNLICCHLSISFSYQSNFPNPTVISTSLKHLIIRVVSCSLRTLGHLCQQTPNLKYLLIRFDDHSDSLESILPIQSITRLNIYFTGSRDILKQLLQNLPNLRHLTCEINGLYINGYQWEETIREYLPKLQIFLFQMNFLQSNNHDKDSQLNDIVETFQTKFWIDEHRWFVRCHWYVSDDRNRSNRFYIFTLPDTFHYFTEHTNCVLAKSTDPSDDGYLRCPNVNYLDYISEYFRSSVTSLCRLSNIKNLTLTLPFDDQFLSVVSNFDRLTSLKVFVDADTNVVNSISQLQLLLDRAFRLRSLSFGNWLKFNSLAPLMRVTSVSVRQLDLGVCASDDEQYSQLIRSVLGKQCETLTINVKNRRSIVDLVNNMPNLQVLIAQSDDDAWSDENYPLCSADEELGGWLYRQLPFVYSITRGTYSCFDILLWIR